MPKKTIKTIWEVVAPEPFVLDPAIADSEYVNDLSTITDQNVASAVITYYLHPPTTTFTLECEESELVSILCHETKLYTSAIQPVDDVYVLTIVYKPTGEVVGRGEVRKIQPVISKSVLKKSFNQHMVGFFDRLEVGQNRFRKIMKKVKDVQVQSLTDIVKDELPKAQNLMKKENLN